MCLGSAKVCAPARTIRRSSRQVVPTCWTSVNARAFPLSKVPAMPVSRFQLLIAGQHVFTRGSSSLKAKRRGQAAFWRYFVLRCCQTHWIEQNRVTVRLAAEDWQHFLVRHGTRAGSCGLSQASAVDEHWNRNIKNHSTASHISKMRVLNARRFMFLCACWSLSNIRVFHHDGDTTLSTH